MSQFHATLCTEMLAPIDGAVGHDIGNYVIDAICSLILRRQFKLTQHISASCQLYENTIFVKNTTNNLLVGKHMETNIELT